MHFTGDTTYASSESVMKGNVFDVKISPSSVLLLWLKTNGSVSETLMTNWTNHSFLPCDWSLLNLCFSNTNFYADTFFSLSPFPVVLLNGRKMILLVYPPAFSIHLSNDRKYQIALSFSASGSYLYKCCERKETIAYSVRSSGGDTQTIGFAVG